MTNPRDSSQLFLTRLYITDGCTLDLPNYPKFTHINWTARYMWLEWIPTNNWRWQMIKHPLWYGEKWIIQSHFNMVRKTWINHHVGIWRRFDVNRSVIQLENSSNIQILLVPQNSKWKLPMPTQTNQWAKDYGKHTRHVDFLFLKPSKVGYKDKTNLKWGRDVMIGSYPC